MSSEKIRLALEGVDVVHVRVRLSRPVKLSAIFFTVRVEQYKRPQVAKTHKLVIMLIPHKSVIADAVLYCAVSSSAARGSAMVLEKRVRLVKSRLLSVSKLFRITKGLSTVCVFAFSMGVLLFSRLSQLA